MSELTDTILRGTSQVKDAYQGLATLNAVNRSRKDRAMQGIGDNLNELAGQIRQYGSWKDAKTAEDESRQVADAYALGMQTGDPSKALVTLGAVRPTTRDAATLRAKYMDEAMKTASTRTEDKLRQAETFHYEQQTEDLKRKAAQEAQDRADAANLVKSGGIQLPPDASEAEIQLAQQVYTGQVKRAQAEPILKMYAERRKREDAARVEAEKSAKAKATEDAVAQAWAAYTDESPVQDPTTGAMRPKTLDERHAAAMRVPGLPAGVQKTITGLKTSQANLEQRKAAVAASQQRAQDDMALKQARFAWEQQAAQSGMDLRVYLAQNAQAVESMKSLLAGADKQIRGEQLQKAFVGANPGLTDAEKQTELGKIDAATKNAEDLKAKFDPLLKTVAAQIGKAPPKTGVGLGAQGPVIDHTTSDDDLIKIITGGK